MKRIPATIVTGFLGAGKTSLVRHQIEHANGRRIAIVINEFGDLGIDRELLLGCGIDGCADGDIVELTNGCICCTVADDFLPAITALLERADPPDHIVIETSGLALPKPLVKAFAWPEVRSRVTVDGVVTVVDAPAVAAGRFAEDPAAIAAARSADASLDHDSPLAELFEDQLAAADLVVLNKTDQLDAAAAAAIANGLGRHLRPGVKTVAASHGRLDPAILLGLDAAAEDDVDSRRSHHDDADDHDHDDFDSFSLALGPVADPAALEAALIAIVANHDVLRVKGFLDVPDRPLRHIVQGVGARFQRYYDRPWADDEARATELVFIGCAGPDRAGPDRAGLDRAGLDRAAIAAALRPWAA